METKEQGKPPVEKQQPQLAPNELWQLDHVSTRYDAKIAIGVPPKELLVPAFWAHHSAKLRPWDEIRARAEDGTWIGTYLVLDSSRTWTKVHQLSLHHLTTSDVSMTQASEGQVNDFIAAHKVTYRGPHKWSVVRASDNAVLLEGKEQKDDATSWLRDFARAQVGAPPPAAKAVTA